MTDHSAQQPVIFELDRLSEYSDDAILSELRRVAILKPFDELTTRLFQSHSKVSFGTVIRRFGSWENALFIAGLGERWNGSRAAKLAAVKNITNEEILEVLTQLARRLGKQQLTWRDVNLHLPFNGAILKKRWGSVTQAFEAAGLKSSPLGYRYSDEECFDNMLVVWTHYGRPPRIRDMTKLPSVIGSAPYLKRFGKWNKALAAFVERVNSDMDPVETDSGAGSNQVSDFLDENRDEKEGRRDQREIPLGLRFKVLHRDRFRCVLCGDSPSSNLSCVLHIDHIIPWSKNGRTILENLRSLCGACNMGRGNRYED